MSYLEGPQQGKSLYELDTWKAELRTLYDSHMNTDLLDYCLERYEGSPVDIIGANRFLFEKATQPSTCLTFAIMSIHRLYLELEISCMDGEEVPYTTPTVVYRWA